ncbi:MAG: recombination mediator RecR [Nitrospirota bacterium]|jgi:recombination protein RecR
MGQGGSFNRLIEELMRLPGIGPKTAQRLAFFMLKMEAQEAKGIAQAIIDLKDKTRFCRICNNITEDEICGICSDAARDKKKVLVIEEPSNLLSLERTKEYKGLYHVLTGVLSPLDGIGPKDIKIDGLMQRLNNGNNVEEVIIATSPTIEGEATARYLSQLIRPTGIKTTRIAYGVPVGSDLEYADEATLIKALEGRREI